MKKIIRLCCLLLTTYCLLSFAQAPDTLWTRTHGGMESESGFAVQQTSNGGYIIIGTTHSFGTNGDIFLVKTDSIGQMLWTKTYGEDGLDVGYAIQQISNGGYILAGYTGSFGPDADMYVIKTNTLGDTLWTRTYDGSGYAYAYSIQQTLDEGYVIAGYTWPLGGNEDVFLVRTDSQGDTIWTQIYGGTGVDYCRSIQKTLDLGYILVGATTSFGAGQYDIWLIKLAPDTFGIEEQTPRTKKPEPIVGISPNPFSDEIRIMFQLSHTDDAIVEIYDIFGRLIRQFDTLTCNQITWDGIDNVGNILPSGVYFLKYDSQNYSETKKLLLIR